MIKVIVLGAHGQVAQLTEKMLFTDKDIETTLFLRNASRLSQDKDKATIIEGDATNEHELEEAIKGQDVVYANLGGTNTIVKQAKAVVEAMNKDKVKRLIWISTLGIYDEVAGKFGDWNKQTLGNYITEYAKAAKIIEDSDLDYTIIRPSWMTNKDEVDYQRSKKGEEITNTEVSRKSVASYVYELIKNPKEDIDESIGLEKPHTEGDKPEWYR
ncbi:NAD(P)H-binding protein [Lactobacillus sp. LL6]|uniref:NAD(P)H-binding protein n=1 Tax=Lactobacillus sp. LL6 TaxID=2596827 RepID=UPI001185753C|nr:NAD(P)H-binding protein [Lactobacillus sp. LL6]TSO26316.1 NAD-dependent epimerase/dehydratase family protein [Lactobacillus sp. LL6]